jgi:DNA repair exonuclease SbcCD nuclease subunit
MSDKPVFSIESKLTSPTFICSADIHLGKKLYNKPVLEEVLKNNFVRLVDLTISKKVEYLIITGDLFEDNNHVRPNMIAFVSNQVQRLKKHNIRTVGIAGDHDKPVKGDSWINISGVAPVTIEPAFTGIDYFDYSTVTHDDLINLLKDGKDCNKVIWIFLHCQFLQLFDKAESKKTVDYNKLRIFENFPNIQGIIAGDLHFAPEGRAYGVNHEAYVGYPGSLSVLDKSEYKHKKHVIWCDGKALRHIPFPISSPMLELDFRGEAVDKLDITTYTNDLIAEEVKPVIYLYYDSESQNKLSKLAPIYTTGSIVVPNQLPLGATSLDESIVISNRSETSTEDKIESALTYYCGNDKELYELALSLLQEEDTRDVLDKFKEKYDNEQTRILENGHE